MPLPFDLASLITRYTAPASSRVDPMTLQRMQFEQGKKEFAQTQKHDDFYMGLAREDRDYGRDSDAWDKIREAVMSGEPELMALAQAEAARRGFAIDFGATAGPAQQAAVTERERGEVSRGTPGSDPTLGGTLLADDSQSPERVDFDADSYVPKEDFDADDILAGGDGKPARPYAQVADFDADDPSLQSPGQGPAPWLAEYMGQKPPQQGGGFATGLLASLLGIQAPGGGGQPQAPPAIPKMAAEIGGAMGLQPEAQKKPSGGFTVRDRTGKVIFQADQGQIVSARTERVGQVFDSYIAQAGDDEEKAAANIAKGVAQKAIQAGYTMKEAIALGIAEYNKNVDPYRKAFIGTEVAKARGKYRYGDGSGGGGTTKPGMGEGLEISTGASRLADDEGKWIERAYNSEGLKPGVLDAAANLDVALNATQSNEGMSQMSAVRGFIASISGKVVTNAEARDYFQSTGLMNELERLAQRTFGQGELPQELMRQLKSVLLRAKQGILQRKRRAAGRAAGYAMSNPNYGEQSARRMAEWIGFPLEQVWKGSGGGGKSAPSKSAGNPNAEAEADRLLNK